MKCPKCRRQMTRQKTGNNSYRYVCPNCNHVITANKKQGEE